MLQEVVAGLAEPTTANQVTIGGMTVFERVRNLRFISRFGEGVVRPRRCYGAAIGPEACRPGCELGIDGCFGFSPLMTFLICMLGADESYGRAADKLAATLGFKVSSTAVQRTTEKTGERIPPARQPVRATHPLGSPEWRSQALLQSLSRLRDRGRLIVSTAVVPLLALPPSTSSARLTAYTVDQR